jgi:predicted phosphodiesterase
LRRLLESLLQEDRDDDGGDDEEDSEKESAEPKPETYDGYGFEKDDDKKREEFNFAAVSDFGCSKNAKKTINNIEEKKPELVLALGDLSVDKTADCWFDVMSPLKGKITVTLGYHDVKDGKSKMNQYINSFDLDELYYSFDYRHVHFIVMSTLSDFNVTSDQYKFIEEDLKKASENEDIDWIVVTSYGPFYTSPSIHPAKNDVRNIYHPLFDRYGVDLVLNGHNHNYQRTYPVTFNPDKTSKPTVTNTFTTGYSGSKDGIVYAIVGTAGEGFHPLEGRQPYVATQFADKFGFLDVEIGNGNPHTNLTGTFYDNKGSNVTDYFTIEKEINGKEAAE